MSNTTQSMIEVASKIASEISDNGKSIGVLKCDVDDWGRFGNFSLICELNVRKSSYGYKPNNKSQFSLLKIVYLFKTIIKKYSKEGAKLRSHESPQAIYSRDYGQNSFEGYERSYITIDLDFIPYNPATNLFAIQEKTKPKIENTLPQQGQFNFL